MTAMNPHDSGRSWRPHSRTPAVQLYLSDRDGRAGMLVGERVAGFSLNVTPIETATAIDAAGLNGVPAAIIEVSADDPQSIRRFQDLAKASRTPLIAAVYEPPLALVRSLIRAGAHDVVPLPLDIAELEASLAPIHDMLSEQARSGKSDRGKLVSVIKSAGGAGATALLGQLAIRFAQGEAAAGREVCLLDLDVQFGDASFQLGLNPALSLSDLLEAGSRLDHDLLRSTMTAHPSGLKVIAAPLDMMPLDALSSEQVVDVVDVAQHEFATLFVDLPANWTNWSLSLLARSDLVLLVTELTVPALRQARRQLDLMRSQELGDLDVRVLINRYEKNLFKTIRPADIRAALGRDVSYTVADDPAVVRAAVDQGVPIAEIKRKSAVGRDIAILDKAVAAALGLEH